MATIKDIKAKLDQVTSLSDPIFDDLASDKRIGVKKALTARRKALKKIEKEAQRLEHLLSYERQLYAQGYQMIAGVDEVGRGPLAGPVVAAAVILPVDCKIEGLNDSKQIPKNKHLQVFDAIMRQAHAVGLGIRESSAIDSLNIYEATKEAMSDAVSELVETPDYLLIDAMTLETDLPQLSLIKGDAKSMSIAAASIVAKVVRDQMMATYDQIYPGYDFKKNAGYGTASHLKGLEKLGASPIHRQTFEPIKSMLEKK